MKINYKKLYESRITEINGQLGMMARKKAWKNYGALKLEKEKLIIKLQEMEANGK